MKRQGEAISAGRDEEALQVCRSNTAIRWRDTGTVEFDLDAGRMYADVRLLSMIMK
jgi:hypothetical protein